MALDCMSQAWRISPGSRSTLSIRWQQKVRASTEMHMRYRFLRRLLYRLRTGHLEPADATADMQQRCRVER